MPPQRKEQIEKPKPQVQPTRCFDKKKASVAGRLGILNRYLRHNFAHLEADEMADGDFVAQLLGDLRDVLLDADFGIAFHETLVTRQ